MSAIKTGPGSVLANIAHEAQVCVLNQSPLETRREFQATKLFQQALAFHPESPASWNRFGVSLLALEDFADAIKCFERALLLDPRHVGACVNLGNVYLLKGCIDRAVAWYQNALRLDPYLPELHCNLGSAFKEIGLWTEAERCYEQSLQLNCQQPAAHFNLATILETQENFAEADRHYQQCLRLEPGRTLRDLRRITMCPTIFPDTQAVDEFRRRLLADVMDFSRKGRRYSVDELAVDGCAPPFNIVYQGRDDRSIKEAFASIYHDRIQGVPRDPVVNRNGEPRIGVVVTRRHERALLRCMGGVLDRLPDDLGEVYIFCPAESVNTVRLGLHNERLNVVPVPRRLDRIADCIRQTQLDVLYHWEAGTDATNYLLPFLKLAPVQCTSWGIPVTSAIPAMNYYLSSQLLESEKGAAHYTEQLVLLDSLLCFYERRPLVGKPAPPAASRFAGKHVYLCAQYLGKFHPDFDAILRGILTQDVHGVIAITAGEYPVIADKLRQRFYRVMPEVADRIVFLPSMPDAEYLQQVSSADVVLDPLYYGGATTIYDAFMLSQPVVTLATSFQRGRYAAAMYRRMGIESGIAKDPSDYVRLAVAIADDRDFQMTVRQSISHRLELLIEDRSVVDQYTAAFRRLVAESRRED